MDELARRVGERLKARSATVVTAESCTGGWVAQAITSVAGSSAWFDRGFITYSNDAKRELLGVHAETLAGHGAVSEETAREMARGALERSGATFAVSVTGIAGPGGGTPQKPVGTVCFAWAGAADVTQRDAPLLRRPRKRAPSIRNPRPGRGIGATRRRAAGRIILPMASIRPAAVAGLFYPGERGDARRRSACAARRRRPACAEAWISQGADRPACGLHLFGCGGGARLRRALSRARHRAPRRTPRPGAPGADPRSRRSHGRGVPDTARSDRGRSRRAACAAGSAAGGAKRPRACARAFARSAASLSPDAARRFQPGAARGGRGERRRGRRGAGAALGRRRNAHRHLDRSFALPRLRRGARGGRGDTRPHRRLCDRHRPRGSLWRDAAQWAAVVREAAQARSAPACRVQLRRHRRGQGPRRRLFRLRRLSRSAARSRGAVAGHCPRRDRAAAFRQARR